ncbi:hypothetical protein LWE61_14970 [Sphingobium sufflavum]|uniref:hypothetical protein n=1 Tax=Sphingobium sufflavum TaxID=1129547 RepID=UPI001F26CEDE|nr:hypothetical protein [Sphingobium sufflavum]MCE7797852.1 hypothetical protein [Sphingobium sufflavum]
MTISPQEFRQLQEVVGVLSGRQGDGTKAAMRKGDGEALRELIAKLRSAVASLERAEQDENEAITAIAVPPLASAPISAAPTQADFNSLQADVAHIRAALIEIVAALT